MESAHELLGRAVKRCHWHITNIDTEETAREQARMLLSNYSVPFMAEMIGDMNPYHDLCCASTGYTRYLLANAFRAMLNCNHVGMTRVDDVIRCDHCHRTWPDVRTWLATVREVLA